MRSTLLAPLLPALALLAACGGSKSATGPWLTDPGVTGHAAFLPLASTVHDPGAAGSTITCNDCHGQYTTFKQFDCTTSRCHLPADTDPIHVGVVTGYPQPPASADCYHCHPAGTGVFADHPKFFPIGAGTSHALGCTQCHTKFDLTSRRDPTTLLCATCHDQLAGFSAKHANVKDFVDASASCVRCHADGQVDRVAAHALFSIASGSTTHDTACTTCHDAYRTDKPAAADFTTYACLGCHALTTIDPTHVTIVSGYPAAGAAKSTDCYGCHKDGTAAPANHPALFPIAAGTAHAGVGCTACHGQNNMATPVPATFQCAPCHQGLANWAAAHSVSGYEILIVHTSQNATQPVAATSDQCLKCHADSQVNRVASHPQINGGFGPSAINGSADAHAKGGCLTCHTTLRTDKPFQATDFSNGTGCATCHPNGIPQ